MTRFRDAPWLIRQRRHGTALGTATLAGLRGRPGRRLLTGAAMPVVTPAGVVIGLLLAGHLRQDVGPFEAEFSLRPSLTGGTDVQIPPLGGLEGRRHSGPGDRG